MTKIKISAPLISKDGEISMINQGKTEEKIINKRPLNQKDKFKNDSDLPLCDIFLNTLLNPTEYIKKSDMEVGKFKFKNEQIYQLAKECIEIVKLQPMVKYLKKNFNLLLGFKSKYPCKSFWGRAWTVY